MSLQPKIHFKPKNIFRRMKPKEYFLLLKDAFKEFQDDNVVKLSASLAYYTVFSIGPLLLVIISLTGLFFEQESISSTMYMQMRSLMGESGATYIMEVIQTLQQQKSAAKYSFLGFIILAFGATGVFADIQDSINYIWSIRAKPKRGWLKFLTNRLLSFSLIVGIGFLLVTSLLVNSIADLLTLRLSKLFNYESVLVFKTVNVIILFFIVSFMFSVIYKVLPDAKISWKDSKVGARFTAFMFIVGKFLIGYYLGSSNMSNTYGAAAAVIIILSWVYYTAIILYFGAEFTKVYAWKYGKGIQPYENSVFIIKREAKELPNPKGEEIEEEKKKEENT
ncbi:MAG TPA: YihY/virulence factor BrkB family protein [Flavipsychrobacter sp.]|nr:YihY/virulence factor BrkB family protein [Flavipsychrobacter sp.]